MRFVESRGNDGVKQKSVSFSDAIMNPAASFGGLYVPEYLPNIDDGFLDSLRGLSYKDFTLKIVELFDIDIPSSIIKEAVSLYDRFDDSSDPIPLKKVKNAYFLELYHGPTRAFKDVALQPFGYLLSYLARQKDQKLLILTATSGDTGPATLESFANKDNIDVVCIYPKGGTSDVQRLQMVTKSAPNLKVIGIEGDFDDAQSGLKELLNDKEFLNRLRDKDMYLSAANSVNFGRIIFQCVYHFWSYVKLLERGEIEKKERIRVVIPSGNFGNALGAFYAKKMGLPIEKIAIVTNANDVLTHFIKTGSYDLRSRTLKNTYSPAMDILKSSNVERVLFALFGKERTKELFEDMAKEGVFELSKPESLLIQESFDTYSTSDEETLAHIKKYEELGYIIDPHTATATAYLNSCGDKKCVVCSTAEWTKFAPTLAKSLGFSMGDKEALELISTKYGIKIDRRIGELFEKKVIHDTVVPKEELKEEILNTLS